MKHLGDVTKINGADVEPADIITFGSPCQDLSVAGKRAGMKHEDNGDDETTRSGLFYEAIRIIKEMRDNDLRSGRSVEFCRPRYAIFENVPGALSSNGGEDFRCVLQSLVAIKDENAYIPRPEKWESCGCIMAEGYSLAYRVHDAQWFGVPQRRRRVCVCVDFNGHTAPNMVFELRRETAEGNTEQNLADFGEDAGREVQTVSESLSRDSEPIREAGEGTPEDAVGCASETGAISFQERAGKPGGGKGVLAQIDRTGALACHPQSVVYGISPYESNSMKSANPHSGIYEADTARTLDLNGGSPACNQGGMAIVEGCDVYNGVMTGDVSASLTAACGGPNTSGGKVVQSVVQGFDSYNQMVTGDKAKALNSAATESDHLPVVLENHPNDSRIKIKDNGVFQSLSARMGTGGNNTPMVMTDDDAYCIGNGQADQTDIKDVVGALNCMHDQQAVMNNELVVRRLTPKECERLQGFYDNWTNIGEWYDTKGKLHKESSDAARYKALGNSIALPWFQFLADNICNQIRKDGQTDITMASLFDGISGFPLVFYRAGCKPVWSSEIEEFPIAVAKKHFGDDERGTTGDVDEYIKMAYCSAPYKRTCLVNDRSTIRALCARDYKGVGSQYFEDGKVIFQYKEDNNGKETDG